jgi:hypothetical protein
MIECYSALANIYFVYSGASVHQAGEAARNEWREDALEAFNRDINPIDAIVRANPDLACLIRNPQHLRSS